MPLVRDGDDLRLTSLDVEAVVPFRRHLVLPGIVLNAAEVGLVLYPLWVLTDLGELPLSTVLRIGLPVAIGAILVWVVALVAWLLPIRACVVARRRAVRADRRLLARGYRATLRAPLRAFLARTSLWVAAALAVGTFLARYQGWTGEQALSLATLAGLHAAPIAGARALWLSRILGGVRTRLFVGEGGLRGRPIDHRRALTLWSLVVASGALIAHAAFLYFLMPITHQEYLAMETYLPPAAALGWCAWTLVAYRLSRPLSRYLEADASASHDPGSATAVYRQTQALPYRLALVSILVWIIIAIVTGYIVRWWVGLEFDDTVIAGLALLVVALAAAIYETLGHRDRLRPVLAELSARYRIPVRMVAPSLGLRAKLLVSFGGVVVLSCGMAVLWGFVQYKKLASEAADRQAALGLAWVRSEVQAAVAASTEPPTPELVEASVRELASRNPEASAVVYYLDDAGGRPASEVVAVGGGPMGAPALTWYQAAEIRRGIRLTIGPSELAGNAARLDVVWHGQHLDLGSVAVLYPDYRGRGQSLARPLRELLLFFVVLFGACAGIVVATVAQFVGPIRRLEQRADAMARGELTEPVTSGGDGDEIGRLTFALEDMRRALRDKLRSTEEVNLDLERAVQRRTADLAKKNKELAETLDTLKRTQAQLVRSDKMASIGQLVAGIAHEINNPVNAIVNTVGPLEEAIGELDATDPSLRSEAALEIRDMVRVVQRGAQRTKAIVGALHNYSRTDDEKVVEFDLNRSLDDSLELLRHLLRGNVTVERSYGEVGRIRGHAGQLAQVFMNLLTNAIQALAGRDDATITIATAVDGDKVVVTIGDNGPGIPPDVVPRIFDPFFTTKDVGEGTGLGLSIVHELVERHEGKIDVDTHLGRGTRFIVTLPRQYEPVRRERLSTRSERHLQPKPPAA
jgi:signal transduction histidine kinase